MPYARYARGPRPTVDPAARTWPTRTLTRAPLWASVDLRDGNQALATPMDPDRKHRMFDLLVGIGFKDIEIGYPSASETDFAFVRELVRQDLIPDDVTVSVFTPARPELIDRTFEALEGADRAMIHLCNATACLWRETVFGMTRDEVRAMALQSARHIARRADAVRTDLRFQYSPETFNVTEPDFALDVCNAVTGLWDACPDRPVTVNLPTTVETDSPNVFADQVEHMHTSLDRRDGVILSVHPHNDRGTAVASAELALLAGADRVEGTLFGNGERTGNVCLITLALNLLTQGTDPQLDLSDLDAVRETVEFATRMPVPPRHPYAGDLVHTAFSGTHQDAIAKGLAEMDRRTEAAAGPAAVPWQVPYLPIDPRDIGRSYASVVRVNSQSGKSGMAHLLKSVHGLDLPRPLRVDFARRVQRIADGQGAELTAADLRALFDSCYVTRQEAALHIKEFRVEETDDGVTLDALAVDSTGRATRLLGTGPTPAAAHAAALTATGRTVTLDSLHTHPTPSGAGCVAYVQVSTDGRTGFGAGIDTDPAAAQLAAVTNAAAAALATADPSTGKEPTCAFS
ncbi:2-isopropylmalate synthase [Streptomyces sp. NPDC088560]|uniref:2-isopropylmalate synthase n=1 Tax=Streptomyces sp. NPDC088560 TaxID=3365868 RepID=UPI0038259B98